ncbi:MAG TPA: hypothetical protein PKC21_00355 [Oligoflexia bacterium]|nr:hypothetical protein [Oligoflexia bacterium]HMR23778.1 hypothetical protein [Oligoflexia bacterium]
MIVYSCRKRGSTLLTFLILLSPLLLFLFIHINNNHLGNKKTYQQTQTDALALHYANYQMDALNAIAMYNKGIEITATRAYMVATALMLLRACAMATLFKSPCTHYWAKLEKKAPSFFNKANQLMAYYAQQQDRIKHWAESAPYQDLILFNSKSILKQKINYSLLPKKQDYSLPIVRDSKRTLNKSNPLYQGNDFQRCHTKKENNLDILNSKLVSYKSKNNITIEVYYRNPKNGSQKVKIYSSLRLLNAIPKQIYLRSTQQNLIFKNAKVKKCESFKKFIHSLNKKMTSKVDVPPFYILRNHYFKNGLSFQVNSQHLYKNITPNINQQPINTIKNHTLLKSSAKACIKGDDIFSASFNVHLCTLASEVNL